MAELDQQYLDEVDFRRELELSRRNDIQEASRDEVYTEYEEDNYEEDNINEEDQAEEIETEDQASRQLARDKQKSLQMQKAKAAAKAKEKLKEEVEQQVKKMALKASLRTANTAAASTIVGIIVTYVVWTVQFFAGNILKSKTIPELDVLEQILWGALTFILISVVVAILGLFVFITTTWAGKVEAIIYFGKALVEYIFSLF